MCTLNKRRATRLVESRKFYKFIREAEDVAEWIGDQTTVAASEDYGRDVEHVELLIQVKFIKIFWVLVGSLSISEIYFRLLKVS